MDSRAQGCPGGRQQADPTKKKFAYQLLSDLPAILVSHQIQPWQPMVA